MAWWQKKLLHYALARTGLFDDDAIDQKNLDVTLGRRNVVELKDVGLNIKRLSLLAHLPPALRVETARVLLLRLTVPADIYQSSIVAEIDGLVISLKLEEKEVGHVGKEKGAARFPTTERSPQHRKVHRRLPSPPAYDPGGLSDSYLDEHMPSTQEMAKSFLLDGPAKDIRDLEATLTADASTVEQSVSSASSGSEVGTGAPIGLPGFLAGFLQGIVDRLQVVIRNVEVKVETTLGGEGQELIPFALRLRVRSAELKCVEDGRSDKEQIGKRHLKLQDIGVDILSEGTVFTDLSSLPSRSSPADSRRPSDTSTARSVETASQVAQSQSAFKSSPTGPSFTSDHHLPQPAAVSDAMRASAVTNNSYRSVMNEGDAGEYHELPSERSTKSDLDIQFGDDNISWGSRRAQAGGLTEDLWNSIASEDELPDSLLLERVSTPRASSSRSQSPTATRSRRAVSPYDRSVQSPGSWPRPVEATEHSTLRQSPGSWPMLDQSQYKPTQPFTARSSTFTQAATDNKRVAMEDLATTSSKVSLPVPSIAQDDDLTQSRFYNHEEAASIYMSAISQITRMEVPGAWASDSAPSEPSLAGHGSSTPDPGEGDTEQFHNDRTEASQPLDSAVGNATPRAQSPELTKSRSHRMLRGRQLVFIDTVSVWLPTQVKDDPEKAHRVMQPVQRTQPEASISAHDMTGAFSAYSEISTTPPGSGRQARSVNPPRSQHAEVHNNDEFVEAMFGNVKAQIDLPCARLLYYFGQSATTIFRPKSERTNPEPGTGADAHDTTSFRFCVDRMEVAFVGTAPERLQLADTPPQVSLSLGCNQMILEVTHTETKLQVGRVSSFLGSTMLLSFDHPEGSTDTSILTEEPCDLNLVISKKLMLTRRPVTEISLETLRLRLNVDLIVADETFGSVGGISGVLELGNSMLSEGSTLASPVASAKAAKGVRFQDDPNKKDMSSALKVNVRLAGCDLTLSGEACALNLRSTSLKLIHRNQTTVVAIAEVRVTGPYQAGEQSAPISVALSNLRLEYHTSPAEKDLERLLSLLTPSKDKYDTDDDILIDTLLRQRRKGALARVVLHEVKLRVANYECFTVLSALGDELARLSAVTKYLPEDDRPGLLTLFQVTALEARVPVNRRFGELQMVCEDLQGAHVGLPALLALSFGTLNAGQIGKPDLIHPLVPTSETDQLPMLMARMIGNEAEPSIKIKLLNVCIEYDVPTLLAISGTDNGVDVETIATELAKSVADLARHPNHAPVDRGSPARNTTQQPSKRTKVDLLVHDSAIGLTPDKLSSKGILVLSHAAFSTSIPAGDKVKAMIALNKAALFVVDAVYKPDVETETASPKRVSNTATSPDMTSFLSRQGYASVASLMSASIVIDVESDQASRSSYTTMDVRNELLLLETCADSTQTLFAVLGGLSPPTPPSKQPKYLTEPMTIEDMMASFTGEPEAKPVTGPETLFDVEEDAGDDAEMGLDVPTLYEDDDVLLDSEMTSSLYGPVSGMLGGFDEPDNDDSGAGDFPETVESLLEEDPFEMPGSPTDTGLSDSALMRDLAKQCKFARSRESIDLGLYEIEDLGFDALQTNNSILGTQHHLSASTPRRLDRSTSSRQSKIPFRLRLRDTHVIWNIYDGYDWQQTRDGITEAVERVEAKAEERKNRRRQSLDEREGEEPVIGDFLFNSIYIGVPGNHDAQELRRQINRGIDDLASETESVPMSGISRPTSYSASGRPIRQRQRKRLKLERSKKHKVAFELKGLRADFVISPPDSGDVVNSVDVRISDCEVFDNVPTSTWRKFLTRLDSHPDSREMSKPMAHVELQNVRTLQDFAASEIVLHVSILPLRLHVDQDALDFITRFFEFKDESTAVSQSPGEQPFIQRIEVDTVDLQLDYKPKYVDYAGLRSGHTTEFMNFVTLDAANIRLKRAIVYGIRGFEPLHKTLNDVWMPDVMRNQLPTVLAGLAPVRSLVNIGSGMRDIVAIPIREYRKDGRIVRSIQKGAFQFGKTTASELARLGAKVAIGTQTMLQGAEGFLSPGSASPSGRASSDQGWHDVVPDEEDQEQRAVSAYANQPVGLLPGLRSARRHLEHDLLTARDALIAVQGEVLESSNPGAAAVAMARHAPTVILRPVIGATRAIGTTLLGVGNQIDRSNVRRMEDKYKR